MGKRQLVMQCEGIELGTGVVDRHKAVLAMKALPGRVAAYTTGLVTSDCYKQRWCSGFLIYALHGSSELGISVFVRCKAKSNG